MEKKVISRFYHQHPLILSEYVSDQSNPDCYGCGEPVANLEMAYICEKQADCSDMAILHKKCGELPNQILHPEHPQHPLGLFKWDEYSCDSCDLCVLLIHNVLVYQCSSCDFKIHIKCAEAVIGERRELQHPSHPSHRLTLMRKPPLLFRCDGCGDEGVDMAYICSTCEFWVHKSCASLPDTHRTDGHHHPLSLVFSLPKKHQKYRYNCDVCNKCCDVWRWAYFCGECRYIVHIKCAIGSSTSRLDNSNSIEEIIEFPLDAIDMSDKLITPFVIREKGVDTASASGSTCGGNTNSSSFLLEYYHEHPLSLVSEFTRKKDDEEDEDEDEDEDEEELKICDACVTPISSTPYYACADNDACTYSIHSICSSLPHTLQSSSNSTPNYLLALGDCNRIVNKNHNFTLYKTRGRDAISPRRCHLCSLHTNGMGYECEDCGKTIDVKCASLPNTIRHASHTRFCHKPLLITAIQMDAPTKRCHGCDSYIYERSMYCCRDDGCDIAFHLKCALLPLSVTNRVWDKHQLLLTHDACLDHPSDFFCEFCEEEMDPKKLMYHCRPCDASFHLDCLDTGSGAYRNVKLGGRYEMDGIPHNPDHPLTFTCITLKKRCDLCHAHRYVYTDLGFECRSCYYVLCKDCGVKKLRRKQ